MNRLLILLFIFTSIQLIAQDNRIPLDTAVVTTNTITIKGNKIPYKATTGMQPVWNSNGKIVASLYYTYYTRTDILEKSLAKEKIHLTSIQSHIHHHEKMCDMMEIKFNELRTLMMDDLGMIKTIKNMLGKHTLERVQMVATHLAEDLEQPPTSVVV